MSCRSWTNSTSSPGTSSAIFARICSMIASAERCRCDRGLRRTSTSPLLGSVANRPSSEPVRRENEATSGVAATIASTLRMSRSVSSSALPGGLR
jgi:hypothetical protein